MEKVFLLGIFFQGEKELSDVVGLRVDDGGEPFEDEDGSAVIVQSVLLNRLHANRHERLQFGLGAWSAGKRNTCTGSFQSFKKIDISQLPEQLET